MTTQTTRTFLTPEQVEEMQRKRISFISNLHDIFHESRLFAKQGRPHTFTGSCKKLGNWCWLALSKKPKLPSVSGHLAEEIIDSLKESARITHEEQCNEYNIGLLGYNLGLLWKAYEECMNSSDYTENEKDIILDAVVDSYHSQIGLDYYIVETLIDDTN